MKGITLTLVMAVVSSCVLLGLVSRASGFSLNFMGNDDCGGKEKSHNFSFGNRAPYDRYLYFNHTELSSKWLRKQSVDVTLPQPGQTPMGTISFIQVSDGYKDGNGGCAYVKNGGVGSRNVTLHLKTQRGQGLNFDIWVYGH